jgi:hypothetical protein
MFVRGGVMNWKSTAAAVLAIATGGGVAVQVGGSRAAIAQPPPRGGGEGVTASLFTLLDANKDGALTRDELATTFDAWYSTWDTSKGNALTPEQVFIGMNAVFPPAPPGAAAQHQTPRAEDAAAMMAALPDAAPVKPKQPRKVLVLAKAAGFVHSSIPLAIKPVLEHITAGMQYVLGDLQADDRPSAGGGK